MSVTQLKGILNTCTVVIFFSAFRNLSTVIQITSAGIIKSNLFSYSSLAKCVSIAKHIINLFNDK